MLSFVNLTEVLTPILKTRFTIPKKEYKQKFKFYTLLPFFEKLYFELGGIVDQYVDRNRPCSPG